MPRRHECEVDFYYDMDYVLAICKTYYKSISRDTKGRGKNSRFVQTFVKMGWEIFHFDLDQGGDKGDLPFFLKDIGVFHPFPYCLPRYFVLRVENTNMKSHGN